MYKKIITDEIQRKRFSSLAKLETQSSLADILTDQIMSGDGTLTHSHTENGKTTDTAFRINMIDAITSDDFYRWMPLAVQNYYARKIVPPSIILQNLFQPVMLNPNTFEVRIWSLGNIEVQEYGELQKAPEFIPGYGDTSHMISFKTSKKGVSIAMSREAVEQDQWGHLGFILDEAGVAFERYREKVAIDLVQEAGQTVMDNSNPNGSELGSATGRNIAGTQNGSFTLNDLYSIYAYALDRGFNIDTVIMHPFAWKVFLADSEMRDVVINHERAPVSPAGTTNPGWGTIPATYGVKYERTGTGQGTNNPYDNVFGKIGMNPWVTTINPMGTTWSMQPPGMGPVKVLTSPRVEYSYSTSTAPRASVIFCDSKQTGVFALSRGRTTETWEDKAMEAYYTKISEKWGMGVKGQGKSIFLAKNIVIAPNFSFQNMNSVALSPLTTWSIL